MFLQCPYNNTSYWSVEGIRKRQNEQAQLYAARYEFVHNRANQITLEEQTQMNEMIHYASTLLPHLWKKMLKKLTSYHRPKTLWEAMDVTMEFEMEYQITQPELDLTVMETCYEEPVIEETYTTEKSTSSTTRSKSSRKSTSVPEATVLRTEELPRESKQIRLWIRLQASVQQR